MVQSFSKIKCEKYIRFILCIIIILVFIKHANSNCLKDYFQCKSSFICVNQVQRCDGIVDCCSGNITDQSDELDCDTIFELKPPPTIETIEGRPLTFVVKLTTSYQSTLDYSLVWYKDNELLGTDTTLRPPFEAYYSEATKTTILNLINPDTKFFESFDLMIVVNDRKRTYEGVCHKKSVSKAISHVNITIRKRPTAPEINILARNPDFGKSITLSCNVLEGFVRPTIKWLKGSPGNMTEFPTSLLVDISNPHNVLSRMVVNTPQQYQGVVLACKSFFDFLNESFSDTSPLYKLLNYTSAEGDLIITAGSSLNLSCLATGFPPPAYSWYYRPYRYAKPRIVKQSFYNLPAVEIQHSGYYQCQVVNEMGSDASPLIQIIVPGTKVSFISFLVGILALIVVIGLIMFFVYRKVSDILERRNKLMLEEAAAIAARRQLDTAGGKKRHNKMAVIGDPNKATTGPAGGKRLKAPPAILDTEKPFVSAMDQEPNFPTEDLDEIPRPDDMQGPPQIPDIVLPGGKKGGGDKCPVVITEFQYPDDDDDLMMVLLKK